MNFNVTIKETPNGKGLFASGPVTKGSVILPLKGKTIPVSSKYSVQLDDRLHIEPDLSDAQASSWSFINHRCEPNSLIDTKALAVVALKDIHAGEEITYNYLTTEKELRSPFLCECKNSGCYGFIRGYTFLNKEEKKKIESHTAPYLRSMEQGHNKIITN